MEPGSVSSRRERFLGVQWHPEDTAKTDPVQAALFASLIEAASLERNRTSCQ